MELRNVIIEYMKQSQEYDQLVLRIRDIKLNKPLKKQIISLKAYAESSLDEIMKAVE
jgi:hypothetical protein